MIEAGFKHGRQLTEAIRHVVATSRTDLAVAYWGSNACDRLRLPADLTGYRVACDAFSGFCSPVALGELLKRRAQVVDVPKLHAKVYRSAAGMVVASANASSRGLSEDEQVTFGLESGVFDDDDTRMSNAASWFGNVFVSGTPISPADLDAIDEAWRRQRAFRPLGMSLMAAILSQSDVLADRMLRAYVYSAAEPTAEILERYKKTDYFNPRTDSSRTYQFFWGEMPPSVAVGDEVLCFEAYENKVLCEGVWKLLDCIGQGDEAIWPAIPIEVVFARGLGPTREVNRRTNEAVRSGRLAVEGDPIALPEFAALIAGDDAEAAHLSRIESADARAAYRLLVDVPAKLGLTVSYKTGLVPAVRWHDAQGRYLFSFIPNRGDLLFYIRKPALDCAPQLAAQAQSLGLSSRRNPAGEQTLRIRTNEDAARVVEWMRSVLPL